MKKGQPFLFVCYVNVMLKYGGRDGGKCEYFHFYNRPTTPKRHLFGRWQKRETKTCHLTKRWKKVSPLRNFNVGNKILCELKLLALGWFVFRIRKGVVTWDVLDHVGK